MTLAADDRRALAQIEAALRRSDPKLTAMLSTFNRLTRSEQMPRREHLPQPRPRLRLRPRRASARSGAWLGRWRFCPPVLPRYRGAGRHQDTWVAGSARRHRDKLVAGPGLRRRTPRAVRPPAPAAGPRRATACPA